MIKEKAEQRLKKISKKLIAKLALGLLVPVLVSLLLITVLFMGTLVVGGGASEKSKETLTVNDKKKDVFDKLLQDCYLEYAKNPGAVDFAKLAALSYASLQGDWGKYSAQLVHAVASDLAEGKSSEEILKTVKQSDFEALYKVYAAMLGQLVGQYEVISKKETESGEIEISEIRNGVKAFHPIPSGRDYTHENSFGDKSGRDDPDQGNRIYTAKDTPVVAIEDGRVEETGIDENGCYQVIIQSNDRRYIYSNLVPGLPVSIQKGVAVEAGDVVGFIGELPDGAYITRPHLHLEIEVKHKAGQTDAGIKINPDGILKFLAQNRKAVLLENGPYDYTRDKSS